AAFEAERDAALPQLEQGKAEIDAGFKQIDDYYAGKAALEQGIAQYESNIDQLRLIPEEADGYQEAQQQIAVLEAERYGLQAQLDALTGSFDEAELEAGRAELQKGLEQYNAAMAQLDAAKKAKAQLDDARRELNKGWREYYEGKQELEDGWNEYFEGMEELPKARKKLNDGEKEYEEGLADLEEAKIEAAEEIADAKDKLADARREVAEIEECEWYILPRGYNPGYTGFGQDAERMANLATVFPVIFFLVAGLVCLTTMTRMVEEHRTEIGLMKALGYGRWTISAKYLSYGLLPSLAGGLVGLVIGHTLFPAMIYISYQIMYEMPNITLRVYPGLSIMSVLAAVACTTVSTLWACLSTLEDSPANLMRPRAPKPGKRVLLERIAPLWKRMSFNWKITSRNLFRYQKRFWMTVIGIGGCTALVIAGVGLRDSLTMSMRVQYDELFNYDAQITYAEGLLDEERKQVMDHISASDEISEYAEIHAASVTAKSDTYSISAYLEAFDAEDIAMFINLRDYNTKESIPLPENGVLIDIKLAELLSLNVGDSFVVDSDGMHEAVVSGIYENYVGHF
ncbi:MAG: FtsX-like permease family protein, partial [Clostridia bacterium]|nr:FtsX-like permease family protein [Clostridia bacterium]